MIRALLERARAALTSTDLNASIAAYALGLLQARHDQLIKAIPELEQRHAELVELVEERRAELAELDELVMQRAATVAYDALDVPGAGGYRDADARLADQCAGELDAALEAADPVTDAPGALAVADEEVRRVGRRRLGDLVVDHERSDPAL